MITTSYLTASINIIQIITFNGHRLKAYSVFGSSKGSGLLTAKKKARISISISDTLGDCGLLILYVDVLSPGVLVKEEMFRLHPPQPRNLGNDWRDETFTDLLTSSWQQIRHTFSHLMLHHQNAVQTRGHPKISEHGSFRSSCWQIKSHRSTETLRVYIWLGSSS